MKTSFAYLRRRVTLKQKVSDFFSIILPKRYKDTTQAGAFYARDGFAKKRILNYL